MLRKTCSQTKSQSLSQRLVTNKVITETGQQNEARRSVFAGVQTVGSGRLAHKQSHKQSLSQKLANRMKVDLSMLAMDCRLRKTCSQTKSQTKLSQRLASRMKIVDLEDLLRNKATQKVITKTGQKNEARRSVYAGVRTVKTSSQIKSQTKLS